jgi:hypothetical protein
MKIIYNSFASKVKSRLADLTDLSRVNVSYYKDTEDIALKYDMNDMLHKAIANGTAMYDDTGIPENLKINGNDLIFILQLKQEAIYKTGGNT